VDHLGTPSPDGKYLAITDWKTGNLAIRETATGAIRPLTDNRNWHGWAEFPVPSPDGKQIAYAWMRSMS
jgi:Tol biopolymer transport system component